PSICLASPWKFSARAICLPIGVGTPRQMPAPIALADPTDLLREVYLTPLSRRFFLRFPPPRDFSFQQHQPTAGFTSHGAFALYFYREFRGIRAEFRVNICPLDPFEFFIQFSRGFDRTFFTFHRGFHHQFFFN